MANKSKETAIQSYTETVLDKAFPSKSVLDGNDILALTEVEQINYMLIYLLFDAWQNELDKLKSPYFNFESDDVKEAMKSFMNVVSKNISIDRGNLQSLLTEACEATLAFVEKPKTFLKDRFGEKVSAEKLRSFIKFAKVYKEELTSFADGNGVLNVVPDENLHMEISTLLGIAEESTEKEEVKAEEEKKVEALAESEEQLVEEIRPEIDLSSKGSVETKQETLNDKLAEDVPTKVGEKLSKIESIKSAIGLNQKFAFIRELYNGDEDHYSQSINTLDQLNVKEEAFAFFNDQLQKNSSWHIEDKEVQRLFELIERRFADN